MTFLLNKFSINEENKILNWFSISWISFWPFLTNKKAHIKEVWNEETDLISIRKGGTQRILIIQKRVESKSK